MHVCIGICNIANVVYVGVGLGVWMQNILYEFVSILSTPSNSCSEQILFQRQM